MPHPATTIGRVLDSPPLLADEVLRDDTRLTARWRHGELHDSLPGMMGHVVMTYYAEPQDIIWRSGKQQIASKARPGNITVIPHQHGGSWDILGPIEVSHVYLSDERLQASAAELSGGRAIELVDRVGFDDPSAARILEILSREAASNDPSSRLFIEQAIDLLSIQLVRAHSSYAALPVPMRRGLQDWQIKRVTSYMRDRLGEEIGLDELAGITNLSRYHFITAFRRGTGYTPHEWLVMLRVSRARELLADRSLTITDIGLIVGYGTPSSFAAAFRKHAGVTPSEFRRRL